MLAAMSSCAVVFFSAGIDCSVFMLFPPGLFSWPSRSCEQGEYRHKKQHAFLIARHLARWGAVSKGGVAALSRTAKRAALASTRAARRPLTRGVRQRDTSEAESMLSHASTAVGGGPLMLLGAALRAGTRLLRNSSVHSLTRDSIGMTPKIGSRLRLPFCR